MAKSTPKALSVRKGHVKAFIWQDFVNLGSFWNLLKIILYNVKQLVLKLTSLTSLAIIQHSLNECFFPKHYLGLSTKRFSKFSWM